jgi:hypothetical protein
VLGLAFGDVHHGVAACDDVTWSYLEATRDGGATWRRVAIPAT